MRTLMNISFIWRKKPTVVKYIPMLFGYILRFDFTIPSFATPTASEIKEQKIKELERK